MEITPVPHPTPALSRGRVLGALLVLGPVVVLVFLPTVLGLQRHVVVDDAMAGDADGSMGRGSVALTREVPATDLEVGDVITFRPPVDAGLEPAGVITRRVVAIEDGTALTRGDNVDTNDPWRLDTTSETYPRVVLAVPWIGYPFSGDAGQGGWLVLVGAIGTTLALSAVVPWRRMRYRHGRARPTRHVGVP